MTRPFATSDLDAPPLPRGPGDRIAWRGLEGGASSLALARAAERHGSLCLALTADSASAHRLCRELEFFRRDRTLEVLMLPDWETLPYDPFSPHQDITSERLLTLHRLPTLKRGVLVVPMKTALQRLPPTSYLTAHVLRLRTGERFDPHAQRAALEAAGYRSVETVTERGEFAVRGSLLDVFPMGAPAALRIDLDDDVIESLRTFDPDTQRTTSRIDAIEVLPAKEFPLDEAAIAGFRRRWHETFDVDVRRCSVYQDVSQGLAAAGVEFYLPLFFDRLATLFDFLPADCLVVRGTDAEEIATAFRRDVRNRYESLSGDLERPLLAPDALYLAVDELFGALAPRATVVLGGSTPAAHFDTEALPDLEVNHRARQPAEPLQRFLASLDRPVLFCAETAGRREVLSEFLARAGIRTTDCADFEAFRRAAPSRGLTIAAIDCAVLTPDFAVVTETQLFGSRAESDRIRQARRLDPDQIIRNLTELNLGAPVVHVDHGVGRYQGLTRLDIDGVASEFLTIEYAEGATLYVPVTSLHFISRYTGADEAHAPLHRLGSDQWEKARRRAAEKIHDVAVELLDIQARRALRGGMAMAPPDDDFRRFADEFPFEVTPDQRQAIDDVIADLTRPKAMDRLVCGDVGFGKTEVAMRAAFLVVQNRRQVAVLVPTTLLAQQHYDSFRDRFADWPVQIEVVSRMRTDAEVRSIQDRLAAGRVDIVIGTHRLLSTGFDFSGLGLVVVDEEHRFGVRQKERLRALRAEVHLLTLTATPIPRTLNLAIGGLRDLSIIATPPAKRLSVKTFVQEKRNHVIREAIGRELARGGQVFFLHNEVRNIEQAAADLATLVPEARIGVGHGQMPKRRLEQVMSDFTHRRCNVLVCSTIIENGIDIPNANTIVVERADRFGLAQLHQLRGRVGRSHRQAYAYLLVPDRRAMTDDARKRLEAIEAAGELGVGFTLATHDLEIRGAGELLGEEQSGQIESIGFALYMDMLARAVAAIRAGRTPDLDTPLPDHQEINLRLPALIPSDYVPDVHTRLILYKRIAHAADAGELDVLRAEIVDRFGPLPAQTRDLLRITELKLVAAELGVERVDIGPKGGRIEFSHDTRVDPIALVRLVQREPSSYRLEGGTRLRLTADLGEPAQRFARVAEIFDRLRPARTAAAVNA